MFANTPAVLLDEDMSTSGIGYGLALDGLRRRREPRRHRHLDLALLDGADELGRRIIPHHRCVRRCARRYVEPRRERLPIKMQICILTLPVAAVLQRLQPGNDHAPLRFIEVPAMEILRQHEAQGIAAVVFDKPRLDPRRLACLEAIAAVEDQAFVNCDRLDEAVRPDVDDERGEGFAVEHWQKVGERMKPESHLWSFPMPPAPVPGRTIATSSRQDRAASSALARA